MIKRLIILEDEALIADHLALLLEGMGYEVIGIVDDSEGLYKLLETETPDLILLDINIAGDLDGIDIAHTLNNKYKFPFVFITSNSDSRTLARAKQTSPKGFITKPFNKEQLNSVLSLIDLSIDIPNKEDDNAFYIKEKHAFIKVNYVDVLYVEAADNYSILHTENRKFMLSQTLKLVEEKLSNNGFLRSHRSYLVNLAKIEKVEPRCVFINSIEIPLSEKARPELMARLNIF